MKQPRKNRDWYHELNSLIDMVTPTGGDSDCTRASKMNVLHIVCQKIEWCWKWKRITEDQMEDLSQKATKCWGLF